jgi:hypothetical protein
MEENVWGLDIRRKIVDVNIRVGKRLMRRWIRTSGLARRIRTKVMIQRGPRNLEIKHTA